MQENQIFAGKSHSYQKGRTSYPDALRPVLRELLPPSPQPCAADIGCGTGIFSQILLECGFSVFGVDPEVKMLSAAAESLPIPNFTPIVGSAERIPLGEHSVDLICCAQSFHWFDTSAFRAECDRILRPGGRILLIWNEKDTSTPLLLEYHQLCRQLCGERFSGFHNGMDLYSKQVLSFFRPYERTLSFSNDHFLPLESFLSWCLSSSYSPQPLEEGYSVFVQACRELFFRHASDNQILLPSRTLVHIGR